MGARKKPGPHTFWNGPTQKHGRTLPVSFYAALKLDDFKRDLELLLEKYEGKTENEST